MKYEILAIALIGTVAAHPAPRAVKREVPQEHAHENILRVSFASQSGRKFDNQSLNRPLTLLSHWTTQTRFRPLYSVCWVLQRQRTALETLLMPASPRTILPSQQALTRIDCLQQATADQAFTNAKAAGDVEAMTNALIYRALERNTGSVGLASVPCTSIEAVNPEIAALQQHQDPASDGAQALNKEIAAELARQIAAVGGDPTLANEASTFAPGEIGDQTGAGNTCDDADDEAGCINTQQLRVDDLTEDEIAAVVAGAGAGAGTGQAVANGTANAGVDAGANNAANGCAVVDDSEADDESADAGDAQGTY
ncbi:hypothetical protein NX059_004716 [Plenodomus lindquistii]|nr:hypothetical protein NX059_004716 [Plenodomus lindquistii]